ncbi:AAA family ATPase [Flavobacterium covae]|uniref:AAA family ATPase n=1 Tax=Flavobacterium covae TaxID=2906076 RepID=UPI0035E3FE02
MTKLNNFQKTKQIPDAIRAYLDEKNTNQANLAKLSGVGEAYVSTILAGKTTIAKSEIKDKYYEALCQFIGFKLKYELWRHFDTNNYMLFITSIVEARQEKKRFTFDGDTGSGKTYACKEYKRQFPTNTFLVTCSAIENSKEFAINIAEVVGVEIHGTAGAIIKRVVKKLISLEDAILYIDEAEHIKNKNGYINIIKSLADLLEGKVAFGLVGMGINDILNKGFERNKQNFRQTARRFSDRGKCVEDIAEDIANICHDMNITSKRIINWFTNRIKDFDTMKIITTKAIKEITETGEPISIELLNSIYHGKY